MAQSARPFRCGSQLGQDFVDFHAVELALRLCARQQQVEQVVVGQVHQGLQAGGLARGQGLLMAAKKSLDEAAMKRIVSEIPLGTMASPDECGALTAFLCSDKVRHMTGATFDINGASYVR